MVRRYVKCPTVLLLCKNALIGPKNWSHPNYRWQSHICEEHLRVINLVLCDSLMDSETGHVPPARGFLDLDRVQHVRSSTLIFAGTGPTTSFVRALIVRRRREWCCNSSRPPRHLLHSTTTRGALRSNRHRFRGLTDDYSAFDVQLEVWSLWANRFVEHGRTAKRTWNAE